jgi:hypothetical protein
MKKSLFLGAAAVAVLSLLGLFTLVGCSNPTSEDRLVYYAGIDGEVITAARLAEILANEEAGTYALIAQNLPPLTGVVSGVLGIANSTDIIPSGVTLNLYGNFAVGAGDLVVGGVLNVQPGSTLTTTATNTLTIGRVVGETGGYPQGQVNVRDGATLVVAANTDILLAYGNVLPGETATPVALTAPQIIAAAKKGLISGDSDHGESPAVHLSFGNDSVYRPTAAVPVTTALDLKDLANGIFSTNIAVQAALTEKIENLTIRKNTAVTLNTTTSFTPTGVLTVNGSLTTGATSTVGTGLTRVVVGLGGELTASQAADTFADVTELVVDGAFTAANATLAKLTSLTVNGAVSALAATPNNLTSAGGTGSLTLGAWDFGPRADPILNIKTVVSPAVVITADGFTVPTGSALILSGEAAPTGNVTVDGALYLLTGASHTLKILKDKALTVNGTLYLGATSAADLTLATNALTVTKAVFNSKSETVGGLVVSGTAGTVTLAVSTGADELILADGGTITAKGTGAVTIGTGLTLGANGGVFTFTGAVAANTLTIVPVASTGATFTGVDAADKLAFSSAALLTIPATATTGVVLDKLILDLSEPTGTAGVNITYGGKLTAPAANSGKVIFSTVIDTNDVDLSVSGGGGSGGGTTDLLLASGVFSIAASGNNTINNTFIVATTKSST